MFSGNIKDPDALLKMCADGDDKAWEGLVKAFSPLVYRTIRQKAFSNFNSIAQSDIEEIFQQTFTNIWRKKSLNRISSAKSIPAYLTVIAQNTTMDFFRKNISQKKIKETCASDTTYKKTPRDESHQRQISSDIDDFINGLTVKEREIITCELVYELKHREIAHLMNMPLNTVSTIIARLKHALKERLKEKGYDA
jgi:RNA polymerase sigma-70 factor, ECF subfamily